MAKIIRLPGLIDIHTHLRTPGQTQKEDFYTGTLAAVSGGFTTIIDMPNNLIPVTSKKLLDEKVRIASKNIICDVGFHFGSLGKNLNEFKKVSKKVMGLKLYLNQTTGNFIVGEKELFDIYKNWESDQPILLHAEEDVLDMVFKIVKATNKKTHICHVSSESELSKIMKAKEKGLPVTCGVAPHHLYLTQKDEKRLGPFGKMKPFLKTRKDIKFLWQHLKDIDIIESDHAPHTKKEKLKDAPYGVPGLDTTLSLLLTSFSKGEISIPEIKRLCHTNPSKIFNIKTTDKTFIEVEMKKFVLSSKNLKTKCKWSPFEGMELFGKVNNVMIRGRKIIEDGKIIAKKGSGKVIFPN